MMKEDGLKLKSPRAIEYWKKRLLWKRQYIVDNWDLFDPDDEYGLNPEEFAKKLSEEQVKKLYHLAARYNMSYNIRESSRIFAEENWFISPDFPAATAVEIAFKKEDGGFTDFDETVAYWYRKNFDSIGNQLVSTFPRRKEILEQAFNLHREEKYEVAIPIFLIQADGICYEIFGDELFRIKSKGLKVKAKLSEHEKGWLKGAALEPLRHLFPLARTVNWNSKQNGSLNRHAILHGRSLGYGTEINSLKCFSLLSFLEGVKTAYDEDSKILEGDRL